MQHLWLIILQKGKTWEIVVSLQVLEPEPVNFIIDVLCNGKYSFYIRAKLTVMIVDTCHHFIIAKLDKGHTKQSLSSVLGSTSETPNPENIYFDTQTSDGMLVQRIQANTSFSRRKTTVTTSSSSSGI